MGLKPDRSSEANIYITIGMCSCAPSSLAGNCCSSTTSGGADCFLPADAKTANGRPARIALQWAPAAAAGAASEAKEASASIICIVFMLG